MRVSGIQNIGRKIVHIFFSFVEVSLSLKITEHFKYGRFYRFNCVILYPFIRIMI